jgi:hypothetical protein
MRKQHYELMAVWEAAKLEPIGIIIKCGSDPTQVRAALYRARADAKDPSLMDLEIGISKFPEEGELQIIHVQRKNKAPDGAIDLSDVLDLD